MKVICIGNICSIQSKENKLFASISYNDRFLWVKFVLTDDKPNKNGQRIPVEEFDNIIKTGVFAPIKINFAGGKPNGHKDSYPIGVITNLIKQDDKVIGLGAIWKEEFPEEAEYIRMKVESGELVYLSWELYSEEEEDPEYAGVSRLRNVQVTGVTIVDNPAYEDRTPIEQVAEEVDMEQDFYQEYEEFYAELGTAEKWSREYINNLPDCAFLYIEPGGKKDEEGKTTPRYLRHLPVKNHNCEIDLPHLRNAIARLSQEKTGVKGGRKWLTEELRKKLLNKAKRMLENYNKKNKKSEEADMELQEKYDALKAEFDALKAKYDELLATLEQKDKELAELREFKEKIEAEMERQRRLSEIKEKFIEAGLNKDEQYFEENAEKLLKMDADALEFFIQELVALRKAEEKQEAEEKPFNYTGTEEDLIAAVRNLIRKEKENRRK